MSTNSGLDMQLDPGPSGSDLFRVLAAKCGTSSSRRRWTAIRLEGDSANTRRLVPFVNNRNESYLLVRAN